MATKPLAGVTGQRSFDVVSASKLNEEVEAWMKTLGKDMMLKGFEDIKTATGNVVRTYHYGPRPSGPMVVSLGSGPRRGR